ncbi:MAG: c-type cytochrome [Actinomycetia bacterium]|nr:c-type cytochrome [Actinomycetes bacterium]
MISRSRRWSGASTFAVLLVALAGATFLGGTSAAADEVGLQFAQGDLAEGAEVFADRCARCHEPDGSGLVGEVPPLLNNPNAADAEYVESTIRDGLEGPIEVLGVAYDDAMRALESKMSDDEITAVVAYVGSLAVRAETIADAPPVEVEPGSVGEGHALFTGSSRLSNGGGACVACHTAGKVGNLGGRSLGPDLTGTAAEYGSEAALASWLADPKSAIMQPIFVDRPLTENEIADLTVFLTDAPNQSEPSDPGDGLILAGVAGFLILIGGMTVAWRGMRQTYADRLRSKR